MRNNEKRLKTDKIEIFSDFILFSQIYIGVTPQMGVGGSALWSRLFECVVCGGD